MGQDQPKIFHVSSMQSAHNFLVPKLCSMSRRRDLPISGLQVYHVEGPRLLHSGQLSVGDSLVEGALHRACVDLTENFVRQN